MMVGASLEYIFLNSSGYLPALQGPLIWRRLRIWRRNGARILAHMNFSWRTVTSQRRINVCFTSVTSTFILHYIREDKGRNINVPIGSYDENVLLTLVDVLPSEIDNAVSMPWLFVVYIHVCCSMAINDSSSPCKCVVRQLCASYTFN